MADTKFTIKIDADGKQAVKGLQNVDKQAKKTEKRFSKLGSISNKIFSKKVALGAVVAIGAIGVAVKAMIGEASKMQDIAVQFEVLTGSVEGAERAMQDLSDFAAGTPFQFEEIAQAGKQLLGFGFSVDELKPRLRELGDVSAALGTPLTDLTLIFGQVKAAGKLTGERLLQLQERAVPIGPALAKTMGVAETAVKDLISKGKVDFETFSKAFATLSEKGGVAFGGLEKKSQTLSGRISTLKDNWKLLLSAMGKDGLPIMGQVVSKLTDLIKGTNLFFGAGEKKFKINKELADSITEMNRLQRAFDNLSGEKQLIGTKVFEDLKVNLEKAKAKYNELKVARDDALKPKEDTEASAKLAEKASTEKAAKETYLAELLELEKEFDNLSLEQAILKQEEIKLLEEEAKIKSLEGEKRYTEALKLEKAKQLKSTIDTIKKEKAAKLAQQKLDGQIQKNRASVAVATSGLITAVLGSENKAAFLISKATGIASAIINANVGATLALATIPPPAGAIAATHIKTMGYISAATIAATAIKGFADGGLVTGGVIGQDSVKALLSPGEVIVPPQTSFADIVSAGKAIGTDDGDSAMDVNVTIGFTDDAFEIIESKLIERQVIGVGA